MTSIAAVPIREALRRFLPAHKTLELQPKEMDPGLGRTFSAKIDETLRKFSAKASCGSEASFPESTTGNRTAGMITLVFALDGTVGKAFIQLPVVFIKELLVASLGGNSLAENSAASGEPTNVEKRLAITFANKLADIFTPPFGPAVLESIFWPGESNLPAELQGLVPMTFLLSIIDGESELVLFLPAPQIPNLIAPTGASLMAETTSRLMVEPEIHLRLSGLTLSDIANLKRGDIVEVAPEAKGSVAHMAVQGNAVMACELGQIGARYSARVIGPISASPKPKTSDLNRGGH